MAPLCQNETSFVRKLVLGYILYGGTHAVSGEKRRRSRRSRNDLPFEVVSLQVIIDHEAAGHDILGLLVKESLDISPEGNMPFCLWAGREWTRWSRMEISTETRFGRTGRDEGDPS